MCKTHELVLWLDKEIVVCENCGYEEQADPSDIQHQKELLAEATPS